MWPFKRKTDGSGSSAVTAPVDLSTPVTNPRLVSAIDRFGDERNDRQLQTLIAELNRANYLVAMLLDEATVHETDQPGEVLIEQGSQLNVITASDAEGNALLPLFTDRDAIRAWLPAPVRTLVMPAADAWSFALDAYQGVIINPAGPSLPLDPAQVEDLQRQLKH